MLYKDFSDKQKITNFELEIILKDNGYGLMTKTEYKLLKQLDGFLNELRILLYVSIISRKLINYQKV